MFFFYINNCKINKNKKMYKRKRSSSVSEGRKEKQERGKKTNIPFSTACFIYKLLFFFVK